MKDFSSVGVVESVGTAFLAHVQWKEKGVNRHSRGPRRAEQQIAQEDLQSMRAAASGLGRDEGYAALADKARLLHQEKTTPQKEYVEQIDDGFRAHVQWSEAGTNRHAHGPRRGEKRRAELDLVMIFGAAENCMSRSEGRRAMLEEATRLQRRAEYEARIAVTAHRLATPQQQPQPQQDVADDSESDWDEGDPYAGDETPPWEECEKAWERGDRFSAAPLPSTEMPEPKTPDEATAMLARFRPTHSTPEVLQRLLECRADPDIVLGEGEICPLSKVQTFAPEAYVERMRDLLLQYGATNSKKHKEDWILRRRMDIYEKARLARFYDDPR